MALGRVAVALGLLNLALPLVRLARGGAAGAGAAGVLRPATGPAAPAPADVAMRVETRGGSRRTRVLYSQPERDLVVLQGATAAPRLFHA
jgi:hypothetical protein